LGPTGIEPAALLEFEDGGEVPVEEGHVGGDPLRPQRRQQPPRGGVKRGGNIYVGTISKFLLPPPVDFSLDNFGWTRISDNFPYHP